jgi:hypothetical protein
VKADLSPSDLWARLARLEMSGRSYAAFLGSAISYWKPSSLPTAPNLKDAILHSLLRAANLPSQLEASIRTQLLNDPQLRLEAVLDDVELHFPGHLTSYLNVLAEGLPNSLHKWVADLLTRGVLGAIYTTNQDLLIEYSLSQMGFLQGRDFDVLLPGEEAGLKLLPSIIKLHGSIDSPDSLRTTFTTVGQFGPGPALLELLLHDLPRMPFIVMGYSGNDIDIRPAFIETPIRELYWCGRPGEFCETHFAFRLRKFNRNVRLVELPLEDLPTLFGEPALEDGSREGNVEAIRIATEVSERLRMPGRMRSTIGRALRYTRRAETVGLRHELRAGALRCRDMTIWDGRWIVWWDSGESSLDRSLVLWHNIRAVGAFWKCLRIARRERDLIGITSALQGIGMAIDTMFLGWMSWTYMITSLCIYPRALWMLSHASPDSRRRVMRDRLDLLHSRALVRTGRRGVTHRLRRLCDTGEVGYVRGHARRYLALILAFQGRFDEAMQLLPRAYEEFEYLVARMELEDFKRTKAKILVLQGNIDEAASLLAEAVDAYRAIGKDGSRRKAQLLRALGRLAKTFPGIERRSLFRRILVRS